MNGQPLDCVILLPSIHHVLKAEQLCKQHGLPHDLVPVPRRISGDCGMALALPAASLERMRQLLAEAGQPAPRIFRRRPDGDFSPLWSG